MKSPTNVNLPYRPCVGIMLLNKKNEVFVAQRLDHPSNAWQMPQGGIDPGELAEHAVFRELKEEISTDNASIIAVASKEYRYDIPTPLIDKLWDGRYKGQSQLWFLMRFEGQDEEIDLHTHEPEFSAWRWAALDELLDLIVHFKRGVYEAVIEEFKEYLR